MKLLLLSLLLLALRAGETLAPATAAGGKEMTYQGKSLRDWVKDLESSDYKVRDEASKSFEAMGPRAEGAIPDLLELMKTKDVSTRIWVSWALGSIGVKAAPVLFKGLDSEDPFMRSGCAMALGKIKTVADKAAPSLRRLLNDHHPRVRHDAAAALVRLDGRMIKWWPC
jgi:HEAT repeat protein